MPVVGAYVAGVLIALFTTALSAIGLTLQKLVHVRRAAAGPAAPAYAPDAGVVGTAATAGAAAPAAGTAAGAAATAGAAAPAAGTAAGAAAAAAPRAHWAREPLFVVGVSCMIVSALVSLGVFALVGQSVASAFSGITIVWALVLAYAVLQERVTATDVALALVLTLGAVLCVVFGRSGGAADAGPALSPGEVAAYFSRPAVVVAAPIFLVAAAVCGGTLLVLRARRHRQRPSVVELRLGAAIAVLLAGLFSGATGTCSRAFVGLAFSVTLGGARAAAVLASPAIWLFVVALLASLVGQVASLNAALRLRPAAEVVPAYQGSILLLGTLFGFVFFAEGAGKSGGELVGFVAGVIVLLGGFALLFLKPDPPSPDSDVAAALAVPLRSIVDAFADLHAGGLDVIRRTISEPAARRSSRPNRSAGVVLIIDGGVGEAHEAWQRRPAASIGPQLPEPLPAPPPAAPLPPAAAPWPPPLSPQTERPKSRRLRASLDAALFVRAPAADAAWRLGSFSANAGASRRVTLSPRVLSAAVRASALLVERAGQGGSRPRPRSSATAGGN